MPMSEHFNLQIASAGLIQMGGGNGAEAMDAHFIPPLKVEIYDDLFQFGTGVSVQLLRPFKGHGSSLMLFAVATKERT